MQSAAGQVTSLYSLGGPKLYLNTGWWKQKGNTTMFADHHNSMAGSSAGGDHCNFTGNKGDGLIYTSCGRENSGIVSPDLHWHCLKDEIVLRLMELK